jgi:diguanylate cyclase
MSNPVETSLRGATAYTLARAAIDRMEAARVWPTPINFELWIQLIVEPEGALARDVATLLDSGALTEEDSERLALIHLPRMRLGEEIAETGSALSEELRSVSGAVHTAQESAKAYGQTLDGARRTLSASGGVSAELGSVVADLSGATKRVHEDTRQLQRRLVDSAYEVQRLRESLEQASREAATDGLTSLANRRIFDREMQRACAGASAGGARLSVAILDIDHFKLFNDRWGHQTGDQVIRFVASVIARAATPPRLAARYGGEEFAVMFPGESDAEIARLLESIRRGVSSRTLKRRSTNEDLDAVTISAGFACRRPRESWRDLFARADAALYASKHAGRNRVTNAERLAPADADAA